MGQSGGQQITLSPNLFVGRERELAELVSACESGSDSDTHLFLISGEPGIGKTRLADELASRAKARGMQVLWGRCWEGGGAPAYWPWIQVVRGYLGALDPERRRLVVESEIASDIIQHVSQIVPELRHAHSPPRPPNAEKLDPSEARFRLFDAVTTFLKIGARGRPMLIVLDDIHDADEASLALLRFVARELKSAPILIVATYREAEVNRSPTLSKLIGEMGREARTIPIRGLSQPEVRQFVQAGAGRAPDDALVAKLRATTDGNPLFLDGIVRMLVAEGVIDSASTPGRPFKVPVGVRQAIRGRLGGLSPQANSLMAVAAAIGNEFELNLCRSVAGVSADVALRLLDEASSAGIVATFGQGRYRFCHALIRSAVYDELDTNGRARIHAEIAERMEEIYRGDVDLHLAELAHHFREAGESKKAIDYSIRAGRAATNVLAYTDAMMQFQCALELMECQNVDAGRRADLLASLSGVAYQVDRSASLKYGEAAIALYDSIGRSDKAAHEHIHLGNIFHMRGEPLFNAALAGDHLQRAASELAEGPDSIALADLHHIIAANQCHLLDVKGTARAARFSMEICDRLSAKAHWPNAAAFYAWSLAMSGKLGEGFALLKLANEAAEQTGSYCFPASWSGGMFSLWLGDPRRARDSYEIVLNRTKAEFAPLIHRWMSRFREEALFEEGDIRAVQGKWGYGDQQTRFWITGEWEAVAEFMEQEAEAFRTTGNLHGALHLSMWAGLQYLLFLGDYARAERLFKFGLDDADRGPVIFLEMRARPWLARVYVAMNRLDDAADQVARCRQIMAAGEDWRGLVGTVARAEASVEAARGNYESANRLLESALAIHRRYHTAWEEADTQALWGRALAAAGDRELAAQKFDAAIEKYRSCGVGPRVIEWLTDEKMRALGPSTTQTGLHDDRQPASAKANSLGAFRREGEFWTITYDGATFRLKDAKGLHYIAYLLAHPEQRVHVLDLVQAVEGSAANGRPLSNAASEELRIVRDVGGAEASIDAQARTEYRARLCDLQADLDEAERMNDLGRIDRIRTETEMVGQHLSGSLGLGGRARAQSSSAERARGLVGKNIRSMLEKIRSEHPALGRHFAAAVSTGYFCAYQPDPDRPISWQL